MIFGKNKPFFISLARGQLTAIGGRFEGERLRINSFKFADLPANLFQAGQIVQPRAMAELIGQLLKQAQPESISKQFCYVSLADELAFSKFLTLPKVKEEEKKGVVFHQIKDYLPHRAAEMYLDWKERPDGDQHLEASVAAVKREIIDSYIKTFKAGGWLPLGFEPQAYSLARLASLDTDQPTLVVYLSQGRMNVCFQEKGAVILATSFSLAQDQGGRLITGQLAETAAFWQKNFAEQKKLTVAYLAGLADQELVCKQVIKDNFGLTVKKLPMPIIIPSTLPQAKISPLIPLFGLAFINSPKHRDKDSLTLIPNKVRQEREKIEFGEKIKTLLAGNVVGLAGLTAVYLFLFLNIFFQQEQIKASLSGAEKVVVTPTQKKLERTAEQFNQKLFALGKVLDQKQRTSVFLLDFVKRIPAGVKVLELDYHASEGELELKGEATARETVLSLEENLAELGQVTVPLSSFEESQNCRFQAVVKLKD